MVTLTDTSVVNHGQVQGDMCSQLLYAEDIIDLAAQKVLCGLSHNQG